MEIRINTADLTVLSSFLRQCDGQFVPPLSARVSIDAYSAKIAARASRFEAWDDAHGLIGLAAVYCDHEPTRPAFLTTISVLPGFLGMGVGSKLLDAVVLHLCSRGVRHLDLETDQGNERALRFYARHGFLAAAQGETTLTLRRNLQALHRE